ncbi:Glutamate decarboxylase 2, partial [Perkinsus chesapeaki]
MIMLRGKQRGRALFQLELLLDLDYVVTASERDKKVIDFKDPDEIGEIMRQCGCELSLADGKRVGTEAIVSACGATLSLSARTGHPHFFNTLFGRSDVS